MQKKITYEEVLALVAETSRQIAEHKIQSAENEREFRAKSAENEREFRAGIAETDRQLKEQSAEMEKWFKAQSAERDRQLKEQSAEMEKWFKERSIEMEKWLKEQSAETDRQLKAQSAETDRQLKAQSAETDRQIKKVSKQLGDITDTLGRFAEEQVLPKIIEIFKARNIFMQAIARNIMLEKENGDFLLEIDILLVNTKYSVVVEVKNTLRQKDVDDHIERLNKIKQHSDKITRFVKGTTMYSAVAAMIVTKEVEQYAIQCGLFVIKPNGNNVEISNPKDFEPKAWVI